MESTPTTANAATRAGVVNCFVSMTRSFAAETPRRIKPVRRYAFTLAESPYHTLEKAAIVQARVTAPCLNNRKTDEQLHSLSCIFEKKYSQEVQANSYYELMNNINILRMIKNLQSIDV